MFEDLTTAGNTVTPTALSDPRGDVIGDLFAGGGGASTAIPE